MKTIKRHFNFIKALWALLITVLLQVADYFISNATYPLFDAFDRKVIIDGVFQNNEDNDMGINVRNYWTQAFDDEGNRYAGDQISFSLGSGNVGSGAGSSIPAGASLKMRIVINGVPEAANYIDYIKIDTYPETDKNIIIRNLPIFREGDE